MPKPKKKEKHKTKQVEVKKFIRMTRFISGVFQISKIANLRLWKFSSFLDVFTMSLEKIEVFFHFSGIKQA